MYESLECVKNVDKREHKCFQNGNWNGERDINGQNVFVGVNWECTP